MSLAEQQVLDFEKNLRKVIAALQTLIIKNAKSGYLFSLNADERIRFAPDIYNGLIQALNESGYYPLVSDLINQDKELIAEIVSIRGAAKLPTAFSQTSKDIFNALQRLELTQFESIGTGFMNSLSQELTQFVLTGVDETVFIDTIRSKLESGLQRYATTYATTSRAKFAQQVQDEAAKNYDGELYWEYTGPVDDRMRDACIDGMNKQYFTDFERSMFEATTAEERAWNCRHIFQQITKEDYEVNTNGR